ncbi:response regulator [Microbacterium sp. NPDC057650]|uniref:response regulator n=1 Tax=unclassified Microbacterium TaxID=2609290 RepID=UPI003671F699
MTSTTALIVDDDPLVRGALAVFLTSAGIEVVDQAPDGRHAIAAARQLRPDVALVDVQMPGIDGVAATAGIIEQSPSTKVLAITTFGTIESVMPMLRAGASGYLVKDTAPEDIVAAVHDVIAGNGVLSPRVTTSLIGSIRDATTPVVEPLQDYEVLSGREAEVVRLLAVGLSNSEIAAEMHVSEGTVKAHLGNVMTKWGVRDRVQVLIRAARSGQVSFT